MLAVGEIVDVYRILEQIGEGGMGVIFRAQHVEQGHHVALKVLRPDLVKRPDVVQRFFREAQTLSEIRSPHIVVISDLVQKTDEEPSLAYMVMELLDGEDLASHIHQNGPLEPGEAVAVGVQVASALIEVHQANLLHRDLKPENIFLVQNNGAASVKLLDFGSAKALKGSEEPQLDLTDQGTAIGTPVYMAPEQITDQDLDERTDIYALGVVLYMMLTGRVPFLAKSYGELMLQLVMDPPPPISSLRTDDPVPAGLEELVLRCLEKDPADRFQSMGELRDALEASISHGDGPTQRAVPAVSGTIQQRPVRMRRDSTQKKRATAMLPRPPATAPRSRRTFSVPLVVGLVLAAAIPTGVGLVIWQTNTTAARLSSPATTTPRSVGPPVPHAKPEQTEPKKAASVAASETPDTSRKPEVSASSPQPWRKKTHRRRTARKSTAHTPKPVATKPVDKKGEPKVAAIKPGAKRAETKPAPATKTKPEPKKKPPPKKEVTNWIREPKFE